MKNIMTTRRPLKLLHMDLFGPNSYKSLGGNSFGLVIVDDFSRFTWVFFLDDKSVTALEYLSEIVATAPMHHV